MAEAKRINQASIPSNSDGSDFGNYDYYENSETDEYGRTILTSDAAGKQLKDSVTYVVQQDVTLKPTEYRAGLVANNNLIYIKEGVNLQAEGKDGEGKNPGLPGIALPSDRSLCISGFGKLTCYGGASGDGCDGGAGADGSYNDNEGDHGWYHSGSGGIGGDGGGGAGAGIGTAGSLGGAGGVGGGGCNCVQMPHDENQLNGGWGDVGHFAHAPSSPGYLCVTGLVTLNLAGGSRDSKYGGQGGHNGNSAIAYHTYKYIAGAGGGGGGGGVGSSANAFGAGGRGGNGGSGGGGGGCVWRARGTEDTAPTGGGGAGGPAGGGSTIPGGPDTNGHTGWGDAVDVCGFKGGGGGGADSPTNGPSTDTSHLLATRVAGAQIYGTQFNEQVNLNSRFNAVDDYTGFSSIPNSQGWYVNNNLTNQDGKGSVGASFVTVIGETSLLDIENILKKDEMTPSREGVEFKGWEFVKSDGSTQLIYDATTKKLDYDACFSLNLAIQGSSASLYKWQTCRTATLRAVWEDPSFSMLYRANKSSFLDPKTRQVVTEKEYIEGGWISEQTRKLWDNKEIGVYLVSAPSESSDLNLIWAPLIDDSGEPLGDLYKPGADFSKKANPGEVFEMNACWVNDELYAKALDSYHE